VTVVGQWGGVYQVVGQVLTEWNTQVSRQEARYPWGWDVEESNRVAVAGL
jgi:hypothetical protein